MSNKQRKSRLTKQKSELGYFLDDGERVKGKKAARKRFAKTARSESKQEMREYCEN